MSLTIDKINDLEQSVSCLQTRVTKMGPQALSRALLASSEVGGGGKHNDKFATCQHVTPACKITAQVSVIQQRTSVLLSFATATHITLLRGGF